MKGSEVQGQPAVTPEELQALGLMANTATRPSRFTGEPGLLKQSWANSHTNVHTHMHTSICTHSWARHAVERQQYGLMSFPGQVTLSSVFSQPHFAYISQVDTQFSSQGQRQTVLVFICTHSNLGNSFPKASLNYIRVTFSCYLVLAFIAFYQCWFLPRKVVWCGNKS